jgi:hypothetical protein
MPDLNLPTVLAATVAAFILGSSYYAILGERLAEVREAAAAAGQPPPWKLAVELARCLILATVAAGLASQGEIDRLSGGLLLGLALWVGFPFVLWTGAIVWENEPTKRAAIHAGDWLLKLVVVAVIVSVWQ